MGMKCSYSQQGLTAFVEVNTSLERAEVRTSGLAEFCGLTLLPRACMVHTAQLEVWIWCQSQH